MERVDAEVHGWPLATWGSKAETDASYKAVLDHALRPEHTRHVRLGGAGRNRFDLALAWLLAQRGGVTDGIDIEMLLGMATAQAAAVRADVGHLLLYTPVVHPREFDVAIAYLVRRLEEGASRDNYMSAVFDIDAHPELFERERDRFLASVDAVPDRIPRPTREQDRTRPQPQGPRHGFVNTPDTDPSVAANRAWGAAIRERMEHSTLGREGVEAATVTAADELDAVIDGAAASGEQWRALGPDRRAEGLQRVGDVLQERSDEQ